MDRDEFVLNNSHHRELVIFLQLLHYHDYGHIQMHQFVYWFALARLAVRLCQHDNLTLVTQS